MLVGYRTIIFNAVMALVFIYQAIFPGDEVPSEEEVGGFLDGLLAQLDVIITIAGNVFLRFKTSTAVFQKPTLDATAAS
jgi:hypothetical protein